MKLNDFLGIKVMVVIEAFNDKREYAPINYIGMVASIEGGLITLSDVYDCTGSKWEKQNGTVIINTEAVSFISISVIDDTK